MSKSTKVVVDNLTREDWLLIKFLIEREYYEFSETTATQWAYIMAKLFSKVQSIHSIKREAKQP